MDNRENDKACPVLGLSMELLSCDPGEKSGPQLSQQNPAGKKKKEHNSIPNIWTPRRSRQLPWVFWNGRMEHTKYYLPLDAMQDTQLHSYPHPLGCLPSAAPTSHFCQQLPLLKAPLLPRNANATRSLAKEAPI